MKKRQFLKTLGHSALALAVTDVLLEACSRPQQQINRNQLKSWIWIRPIEGLSRDGWKDKLAKASDAGIDGILMEVYNSTWSFFENEHLPLKEDILAKAAPACHELGMEFHAWMWTMPCNIPAVIENHPHWYAVNGLDESVLDKPAYVDYYRFLCPRHPEVQDFIRKNVSALARIPEIDGIHLDYVRLPDVILAEALQPKYDIVQDREYPQYDYCYSAYCRNIFKEETGIDPLADLANPSSNDAWRQFRFDSITLLVNDILVPEAKKYDKQISAAVFPNWQSVRQQWHRWDLDAFYPMLYNNFYNENIDWIRKQTQSGVDALKNNAPIFSGVYVSELSAEQLEKAYQAAIDGGARGVSFFDYSAISDQKWKTISKLISS